MASRWLATVGVLALVLALGWAGSRLPVADWLSAAGGWIGANGHVAWIAFMLAHVAASVALSPTWVFLVAGGYFFGLTPGLALVYASTVAGATASFLVARFVVHGWVRRRVAAWPRFRALDLALSRKGLSIVLLSRLSLLFPFALLNYAYGVTGVRLSGYVIGTALGMIPAVLLYTLLGASARDLGAALESGGPSGWMLAASVVIAGGVVWWVGRMTSAALAHELDDELREELAEAGAGAPGRDQ